MLLLQVERFLRASRMSQSRFGRDAVGDPCFVADLKNGREPRSATVTRVLAYIAAREAERRAC